MFGGEKGQKDDNPSTFAEQCEQEFNQLFNESIQLQELQVKTEKRKQQVNLVNDKVCSWTNKSVNKLIDQLAENEIDKKTLVNTGLLQQFAIVFNVVDNQLDQILVSQQRKRQELASQGVGLDGKSMIDDEQIEYKDHMLDFANVEYVSKNIRVRSDNEGQEQHHDNRSEHASKHNLILGEKPFDDDDEKYNAEALHELDDTRKTVKAEKDLIESKRLAEI